MKRLTGLFETLMGSRKNSTENPTPEEKLTSETENLKGNSMKENKTQKREVVNDGKLHVYNLIILDESGSMFRLRESTLSGVNEVIGTIRKAQETLGDKQQHYLSLVTFDGNGDSEKDIRTLLDAVAIQQVAEFTNYHPDGCTPLYDAMGFSLTHLRDLIKDDENATAVVTVVTDGLENASREYRASQIRTLVEQLKEEGWTFSYMGSAHDVKEVTDLLSIDNVMEFSHDEEGSKHSWNRDSASKMAMYSNLCCEFRASMVAEEKKAVFKRRASNYLGKRVTPVKIKSLEPDEILVFGSDPLGRHAGGTAAEAVRHFGAIVGQPEGLQGQSYALPTTGGWGLLQEAVDRFLRFATSHPELKFMVTPVGCGSAGYTPRQIAPLFEPFVSLQNVCLPASFWKIYGITNYEW